jgi:hypothetical protein
MLIITIRRNSRYLMMDSEHQWRDHRMMTVSSMHLPKLEQKVTAVYTEFGTVFCINCHCS